MKYIFPLFIVLILNGCNGTNSKSYDAKKLAEQKCASCHNLDMPPKTTDNEKAPPLFTVTVHLKDWIKVNNPSELKDKFVDFVTDYVINPSLDKSYCDKKSLEIYGLMPSQKGKVTKDEVRAIAEYIFDKYDQKYVLEYLKEKARIDALPPAQQVLETYDCKLCHLNIKNAPSFQQIGKKYSNNIKQIKKSITNGSKGKWKGYLLPMRGYKLPPKQLDAIAKWIIKEGSNVEQKQK
jgi:cytochrome c